MNGRMMAGLLGGLLALGADASGWSPALKGSGRSAAPHRTVAARKAKAKRKAARKARRTNLKRRRR
ncbi:MAG: hypothetical protein F4107_10870 [Gemmatimonadetes bacterium]|nr:hypothetical protein [Gemmatimonadota bacterium]MYD15178.1 hypothetical protein [Gemmatimonadota bacterium]MYI66413.1 hypothetical protein [Gemmatimonadota bacterium]